MSGHKVWSWALLFALLSVLILVLGVLAGGSGWIWPWSTDFTNADGQVLAQILWDIRLPRGLGAWLAGGLLGLAGAVAQGLFRNPLADPYLLGSASGASVGVGIYLVMLGASVADAGWAHHVGMTGSAFIGAWLAVLLTLALAGGVEQTLRLLLAGVVVGVVLGALVSLGALMRPDLLMAMQGFLLGSTALLGLQACVVMALVLVFCLVLAWAMAPVLDALTLGELTAQSLGLHMFRSRLILIAVLSVATGAAVAHTGLIGFVGLAAAHVVRACVATRHGALMLLSALVGGLLLASADLLARWALPSQELPVGLFTTILGGAYLLWRMQTLAGRTR